jgi:hypothetical protein
VLGVTERIAGAWLGAKEWLGATIRIDGALRKPPEENPPPWKLCMLPPWKLPPPM